jgi:hypothetical protein
MAFLIRRQARAGGHRLRISVRTMLGLVVVIGVILAFWSHYRQARVPWHRVGGMIGWSQARIEGTLGQPARTIESDINDPVARAIGPAPPARHYRTLIFDTFDGRFVARLNSDGGAYTCFRSIWVDRNRYY